MVGEATSSLGGNVFQITTSAHRIIDPSVTAVVKDAGTPLVEGTGYVLDRLFGRIALPGAPSGAITVDANWLATLAVAEVRKVRLQAQRAMLDKTTFDSAGWRQFLAGLLAFNGDFEMLAQPTDDLDAGVGGVQSFFSFLTNGTAKMIECTRAGYMWRGWANLEKIENASELDGIVTAMVSFTGNAQARGAGLMFEETVPSFTTFP